MVSYDPDTNYARIYGSSASNPIKTALGAAIAEYSGGLTWGDHGQLDASDHAPFEWAGFQACLLIEGEVWSNPYYHTQQDNVDMPNYIDYAYAVKMTRSIVGFLVDHAGVIVPGPCPGDIDGDQDTDQSDLGILLAAFGVDDGGDLNGDGDTDQADLGILLADWGCGTGP